MMHKVFGQPLLQIPTTHELGEIWHWLLPLSSYEKLAPSSQTLSIQVLSMPKVHQIRVKTVVADICRAAFVYVRQELSCRATVLVDQSSEHSFPFRATSTKEAAMWREERSRRERGGC